MVQEKLTNREKQAKETKQKLIRSAHTIFLQKGFDKTTVSQIIKEAGVGYGTAYVYFENKDDMFVTVMEEVMEKFFQVARQTFHPKTAEEARQQIKHQVEDYLQVAVEERAMMRVVKQAIGASEIVEEKWTAIQNEFIDSIAADIRYSQAQQLVSTKFDPAITARTWYYVNEMFMWQCIEAETVDTQPIIDQIALFYTSALY